MLSLLSTILDWAVSTNTNSEVERTAIVNESPSAPEPAAAGDDEIKRRISFHNKIAVVLIPKADEYFEAGCDLWWNEDDYEVMREDLKEDIEVILRDSDDSLSLSEAIRELCQPEEISLKNCAYNSTISTMPTLSHCRYGGTTTELQRAT